MVGQDRMDTIHRKLNPRGRDPLTIADNDSLDRRFSTRWSVVWKRTVTGCLLEALQSDRALLPRRRPRLGAIVEPEAQDDQLSLLWTFPRWFMNSSAEYSPRDALDHLKYLAGGSTGSRSTTQWISPQEQDVRRRPIRGKAPQGRPGRSRAEEFGGLRWARLLSLLEPPGPLLLFPGILRHATRPGSRFARRLFFAHFLRLGGRQVQYDLVVGGDLPHETHRQA
jgi:hypothetical protein